MADAGEQQRIPRAAWKVPPAVRIPGLLDTPVGSGYTPGHDAREPLPSLRLYLGDPFRGPWRCAYAWLSSRSVPNHRRPAKMRGPLFVLPSMPAAEPMTPAVPPRRTAGTSIRSTTDDHHHPS